MGRPIVRLNRTTQKMIKMDRQTGHPYRSARGTSKQNRLIGQKSGAAKLDGKTEWKNKTMTTMAFLQELVTV